MAFRRIALSLLAVGLVAVACGGDGAGGGSDAIDVQDPIGAPDQGPNSDQGAQNAVVKDAYLRMAVDKSELTASAQGVVDLVSSSRIGGFLDRATLDRDAC